MGPRSMFDMLRVVWAFGFELEIGLVEDHGRFEFATEVTELADVDGIALCLVLGLCMLIVADWRACRECIELKAVDAH